MKQLFKALHESRQRVLLLLRGEQGWCYTVQQSLGDSRNPVVFSNASGITGAIPFSRAQSVLGLEASVVIYDGYSGFDADVFCIAAGLVRAGGILVVLAPLDWGEVNDSYGCWQDVSGPNRFFIDYLEKRFALSTGVLECNQYSELPNHPELAFSPPAALDSGVSAEQGMILAQLQDWLRSDTRCYVLTASRGRGKSTTLGLFARAQATDIEVVVTANSKKQASMLLDVARDSQGSPVFMAPDVLVSKNYRIPLLLIDEAAMLPQGLLWQCIERADKVVMATTTGGYEGTGQGFLLKFLTHLKSVGYQHGEIVDPVRWGIADQLEAFVNDALLLDRPTVQNSITEIFELYVEELSREKLSKDWNLLESIYRLLVGAHYRTRPSDLRQLMEDENQRLILARNGKAGQVVGVLQLNREGGFSEELSSEVFFGRRRPRGHLFAQMLTAQAGIADFATASGYRVQRIAVLDGCRLQGVGRRLIEAAWHRVKADSLDYLAASFALEADNALFWKSLGFRCVHIGAGKGKSTGRKTLAVIRPLSEYARGKTELLEKRFQSHLETWLLTYCNDFFWHDVEVLVAWSGVDPLKIGELEHNEIMAFSEGFRGLELSRLALGRLLMTTLPDHPVQDRRRLRLLVEKILLNRDWDWFEPLQWGGKKTLLKELRIGISECYRSYRLKPDE